VYYHGSTFSGEGALAKVADSGLRATRLSDVVMRRGATVPGPSGGYSSNFTARAFSIGIVLGIAMGIRISHKAAVGCNRKGSVPVP
jgi:hypothetical protein